VVIRTQLLNMDAMASGSPRVSPLHRLSGIEDGARVTQLFEFTLPAPSVRQIEGRTMVVAGQRAFEPQPLWTTLSDGGVAVVHGTGYSIRIIDNDGRAQRVIERDLAPRRVTPEDRERELERRAQLMQSGNAVRITAGAGGSSFAIGAAPRPGAGAPGLAELARTVEFADVIPVIGQVRGDPFGRLWVQRAPARVGDDGAIDLITGTDRYVGTLPPQPLPGAISATGRAAYIVTDDLGVQRVVVRQLPREWL
jgi:hypothetical protein